MLRRSLAPLAALFALTASPAAFAAQYDAAGPHKTTTVAVPGALNAQLAFPDGAGPFPLLVLGHGFSATPDNQIGWGEHFASWGFVAIAPTLCMGGFCAPDPNMAPGIVQQAIAYVTGSMAPAALAGKVDAQRLGLEGHSAGGQAMTVVASMIKPNALVLFDPVPGGMTAGDVEPGKTAIASVCGPTLTLFADPSSCNKMEAWRPFALSSTGPRLGAVVTGSTHCDGENHPRALCGPVCGGAADPKRQGRYAHYATAWFLAYLQNDADAKSALDFAKLQADSGIHDPAGNDGPNCAPVAGGAGGSGAGGGAGAGGAAGSGTAGTAAAGATGAGAGGESGAGTAGAGTGGSDPGAAGSGVGGAAAAGGAMSGSSGQAAAAPTSSDSGGCGCSVPPSGATAGAPLFGLALLALLRRRRR